MLLKVGTLSVIPRRFLNALYVTGDKAKTNIKVLTPVMDFEKRLTNRNVIEDNIRRRKLTSTIDVADIYAQWEVNKAILAKKKAIERRQKQVMELVSQTSKTEPSREKENAMRKYKIEGQTLREDFKNLRDNSYAIEGEFGHGFLSIPNDLHAKTPDEFEIVSSYGDKPTEKHEHHLKYENQIDYYNETAYYLTNDSAKLDLIFPLNCVDYFRRNAFVQFSNPDFAKTILVEGAAVPLENVYEVQHEFHEECLNLIHLVGNGSMLSYLGFIAKLRIAVTQMPLQWVSSGKIYVPKSANGLGLYDVCQSTAVQIFLVGTREQMEEKFLSALKLIRQLFQSLNAHFRIVYVPAHELKLAECMSARIEMYSPHLEKYIEVGNLSNYSAYISKRLLFTYDHNKKSCFPHILSGTVCNVTKMLAIQLETHNGHIPNKLFEKI